MRLVQAASRSVNKGWLKDVAALASIGGFLWVASTWLDIARAMI